MVPQRRASSSSSSDPEVDSDGHLPGEHVHVDAAEARLQTRVDPTSGECIGALMTVADWEDLQRKKAEEAAPKSLVRTLKDRVEEGLARLSAEGQRRTAEKRDREEQEARMREGLEKLAVHAAGMAAVDCEARRVEVERQIAEEE